MCKALHQKEAMMAAASMYVQAAGQIGQQAPAMPGQTPHLIKMLAGRNHQRTML